MKINNLINKIIPDEETRKNNAMKELAEVTLQIKNEGLLENRNEYHMNRLRKNYLLKENKAVNKKCDIGMIIQYRKVAGEYIRI